MSDDNFNPDELNPDRRFAWELCKMLRDEAVNPLAKEFIKLRERVDKLEAERVIYNIWACLRMGGSTIRTTS